MKYHGNTKKRVKKNKNENIIIRVKRLYLTDRIEKQKAGSRVSG